MAQVTNMPYTGDGHTSSGSSWATFGTDCLQVAHATWDFNIDGGAISTITPKTTVSIPKGAILVGAWAIATTALVGASGTMAIGTSAGSSSTSLIGATNVTSWSLGAILSSGVATVPIQMSAAGSITFTIATTALTAGHIEVWVEYIQSPL